MQKIKSRIGTAITFALAILVSSCTENDESLDNVTNSFETSIQSSEISSSTPWDFDNEFSSNDDFQVDNDSNGAHNWDEDDYQEDPIDNGFDVRDYIYVNDGKLVLQCPNGSDDARRRAEFRDQVNIDLSDAHHMDFTFDVMNYDNNSELIMAQLHNDNSAARRPFITVVAENGEIRLQRTNAPTGSSTQTAIQTINYRINNRYRIRMDSQSGTRSVFVSIINLDTDERAENIFNFAGDWDQLDGDFYWKFGAYMPDGGSDDTRMRVERINFNGEQN